jgi:hypothetical protein
LGEVVRLVPGREVTVRRVLDLAEDLFAHDHTVGGRQISHVDPGHHGIPVMPMTFTLAMLAEAAGALAPGRVVTAIRQAQLLRWLAYEADARSTVEIAARLDRVSGAGEVLVEAELRDLGTAGEASPAGRVAARAQVVLAPAYPPAPAAGEFPVTSLRPASLSPEQVYHNLFHGPLLQGVCRTLRSGDQGVEAEVAVLSHARLFRSTARPAFPFDPVLLDVVNHPLGAWHVSQPDGAGRIMLPVGLEGVEFYAPPGPEGTRMLCRSWVGAAAVRTFTHNGETLAPDGSVYLRLHGLQCWRFYLPFGEVSFHGPKDRYFLSRRWDEVEARDGAGRGCPSALVRLEVPADLQQPAMIRVVAHIALTPAEQRQFRDRACTAEAAHAFLFDRVAAKDAIRLLWYDGTGERLFPADIECREVGPGRYTAHRRGDAAAALGHAVVSRAGNLIVALSAECPAIDLAVAARGDGHDVTWTVGERAAP